MKKILILLQLFVVGGSASAQDTSGEERAYLGVGGGYSSAWLRYSDINESVYPKDKNLNGGIFSVFFQYEFLQEQQLAIRPELLFLNRGGRLTNITEPLNGSAVNVVNTSYRLKSHYVDLRVPVIYNFCAADAMIRPYVFIAPIIGVATGGNIKMQDDYKDGSSFAYSVELSKANMSNVYFAGEIGAGAKWQFSVEGYACFLGVEASYVHGFSDTYSAKEKDGNAGINNDYFSTSYKVSGTRKISGFELKATLGIPFSVFKKKVIVVPPPLSVPAPVVAPVVELNVNPAPEKPCYSLEEINDLLLRGMRVEGKTICAIDAINFEFGKSTIKQESYAYLNKLAKTLIRINAVIKVNGHTDNIGSEEYNMNLSRQRAEAVVDYLVISGVRRSKLQCSYYGMSKPMTTNDTKEGRMINRRVEFEIQQ